LCEVFVSNPATRINKRTIKQSKNSAKSLTCPFNYTQISRSKLPTHTLQIEYVQISI